MVGHHVAQRTGGLIEGAALLDATRGSLADFSDRELCHAGWATARLGGACAPDPSWRREFEAQTLPRLGRLPEQELSTALWAFAKWGGAPPSEVTPWVMLPRIALPAAASGLGGGGAGRSGHLSHFGFARRFRGF